MDAGRVDPRNISKETAQKEKVRAKEGQDAGRAEDHMRQETARKEKEKDTKEKVECMRLEIGGTVDGRTAGTLKNKAVKGPRRGRPMEPRRGRRQKWN